MSAPLSPIPALMRQHLEWLIEPARLAHPHLRVEVAAGAPDDGPRIGRAFGLGEIDHAVSFAMAANLSGRNVYVGATLKKSDAPANRRTKAAHAALATALALDIDGGFFDGLKKLAAIAMPQLVVVTGKTPQPRGQAWLRLAPTDDLDLWEEVNRRAIGTANADPFARGRYRVMRLAGTVSYPPPAKVARGYVVELVGAMPFPDAPAHKLGVLLGRFPPAPDNAIRSPGGRHARSRRAASHGANGRREHTARMIVESSYGALPLNPVNVAIVARMLAALPQSFADGYDAWLKVGMALHALGWDDYGLELWERFSGRNPEKADETDFTAKWVSFDNGFDGERVTIGTLRREAEANGWSAPAHWDRETPDIRLSPPPTVSSGQAAKRDRRAAEPQQTPPKQEERAARHRDAPLVKCGAVDKADD